MRLFPWARSAERKRAIKMALDNAARARAAARKAEELAADLRQMEKDKLAWAVMEGFVDGDAGPAPGDPASLDGDEPR